MYLFIIISVIMISSSDCYSIFNTISNENVKKGSCPVDNLCSTPLPYEKTMVFRCFSDNQCPENYKCCADSCFHHLICLHVVFREESLSEQVTDCSIPVDNVCTVTLPYYQTRLFECHYHQDCPVNYQCCRHTCFEHLTCLAVDAPSSTPQKSTSGPLHVTEITVVTDFDDDKSTLMILDDEDEEKSTIFNEKGVTEMESDTTSTISDGGGLTESTIETSTVPVTMSETSSTIAEDSSGSGSGDYDDNAEGSDDEDSDIRLGTFSGDDLGKDSVKPFKKSVPAVKEEVSGSESGDDDDTEGSDDGFHENLLLFI